MTQFKSWLEAMLYPLLSDAKLLPMELKDEEKEAAKSWEESFPSDQGR